MATVPNFWLHRASRFEKVLERNISSDTGCSFFRVFMEM